MFRYARRQKGGYYTREDEGERIARDADTAVLRGVTGCKVLLYSKESLVVRYC